MRSKMYIEEMKNVHASEELILKTIERINNMQKAENKMKAKKAIAGTAAVLTLAFGSVGAYAAITGNTEILEKIGIKVSQNYEDNKQEIKEEEGVKSSFSYEGIECNLNAVSIDSSTMIMDLDLKLDEKILCEEPNLIIDNIEIEMPDREVTAGENFVIEETQSINQLEDGTYKVFKYIYLSESAVASNDFWKTMFYLDNEINVTVSFKLLTDKLGKEVLELKESECKLEFKLNKSDAIKSGKTIRVGETMQYNDVEVSVDSIKESSFGNVITLNAKEKNIDVNKINDIQKIDFIIKDKDGNELKIVSRSQNIVMTDYKNGAETTIILENIQIVVDDINNSLDYTIEIIESDEEKVSVEEIKRVNNEHIESNRSGDTILTSDGDSYPRALVDEKYYYQDEYGIYLTEKTAEEIIEIVESEPRG